MTTPESYILEQPDERQEPLNTLRKVINDNLPPGFKEGIQYNMIGYFVPLETYPSGYGPKAGEPLPFISIANQKNHIALYHMGLYMNDTLMKWFKESWEALNIGKLDIGKSCIRFKNMKKIPFDLIAELCRKITVEEYITFYETNKQK